MTDDELDEIVDYALGWIGEPGTAVDWDDLLYRIEGAFELDLPDQMLDPINVRIKKAILKARREANA